MPFEAHHELLFNISTAVLLLFFIPITIFPNHRISKAIAQKYWILFYLPQSFMFVFFAYENWVELKPLTQSAASLAMFDKVFQMNGASLCIWSALASQDLFISRYMYLRTMEKGHSKIVTSILIWSLVAVGAAVGLPIYVAFDFISSAIFGDKTNNSNERNKKN